ncbi:hypothetical protein J7L48_08765 [bacterium]|nr:hypothetical protein [bacterium]
MGKKRFLLFIFLFLFMFSISANPLIITPPSNLSVTDYHYDDGGSVIVKFQLSDNDPISKLDLKDYKNISFDNDQLIVKKKDIVETFPENIKVYSVIGAIVNVENKVKNYDKIIKDLKLKPERSNEKDLKNFLELSFEEFKTFTPFYIVNNIFYASKDEDNSLKNKFRLPYLKEENGKKYFYIRVKGLNDYKDFYKTLYKIQIRFNKKYTAIIGRYINNKKSEKSIQKKIPRIIKELKYLGKEHRYYQKVYLSYVPLFKKLAKDIKENTFDTAKMKEKIAALNNKNKKYIATIESLSKDFKILFNVVAISNQKVRSYSNFVEINPHAEILNFDKIYIFIFSVAFVVLMLYIYQLTKKGKNFYIRPIAGLSAVEEAVGRSTEMGKPVLYISGLSYISDIATLASINILGQIARKVAIYETPLIVPAYDPIVYSVLREVVREAYIDVGKPEAYQEENVFYLTSAQFAYAAGVNGIMVREKPATIFYMGMFYAEALLMSETGNQVGAIQIAGTDAITQIPFFITSCDYTLIGEELYAASAYLSREPLLLSTLKVQDMGKAFVMFLLVIGVILEVFGIHLISYLLQNIPD